MSFENIRNEFSFYLMKVKCSVNNMMTYRVYKETSHGVNDIIILNHQRVRYIYKNTPNNLELKFN